MLICDHLYAGKIWRAANSRLGQSVSDLYRAKIRLSDFKAVYSILAIELVLSSLMYNYIRDSIRL